MNFEVKLIVDESILKSKLIAGVVILTSKLICFEPILKSKLIRLFWPHFEAKMNCFNFEVEINK